MQALNDAKKEYIKHLQKSFSIVISEKINNLHDEAVENGEGLKGFQKKLLKIKDWDSSIIENIVEKIVKNSNHKKLDKIYNLAIITSIKIKQIEINKKIENNTFDYPSFNEFVHKCYINSSIWAWKNPFLFFKKDIPKIDIQNNYNIIEKNVKKIIKNTLNECVPIDEIFSNVEVSVNDVVSSGNNNLFGIFGNIINSVKNNFNNRIDYIDENRKLKKEKEEEEVEEREEEEVEEREEEEVEEREEEEVEEREEEEVEERDEEEVEERDEEEVEEREEEEVEEKEEEEENEEEEVEEKEEEEVEEKEEEEVEEKEEEEVEERDEEVKNKKTENTYGNLEEIDKESEEEYDTDNSENENLIKKNRFLDDSTTSSSGSETDSDNSEKKSIWINAKKGKRVK